MISKRFGRNGRRVVRRMDNEASFRSRSLRSRRYEEDEKEDDKGQEETLIESKEVSDIVDMAVSALGAYGITEVEYEEDEQPPENEAVCTDEDGNEIAVSVDAEGAKLNIQLDEETAIEVALDVTEEEATEALSGDLEEIFNPEDDEEEDGEDKNDDKDDEKESAEERRAYRRMRQRIENFKRIQAQKRRMEALKKIRRERAIREERESRRPTFRGRR